MIKKETEAPEVQEAPETQEKAKKKKSSKANEMQIKYDELNDKYLRVLAEYDNFKKRSVREKEAIYTESVSDTVKALLPVLDNFERALKLTGENDVNSDFQKGLEMIYNQTVETFEKLGVKQIESVGLEFNPELHNAVMHIEDETLGENIVAEEFQKGYIYRDKVIRYSMVKVAN